MRSPTGALVHRRFAAWVDRHGRQVVARCLDGIRYSRLCLQTLQWEDDVLQALRVAADAIGYAVTVHVDPLRTPERRFLAPFELIMQNEFACAESEARWLLEIRLRLRLDSLESIALYLDVGADMEAEFRSTVHDATAAYVRTLQSRNLHKRFHDPAPVTQPLGSERAAHPVVTVESILRDRIEQVLRRRFGLRVLSFIAERTPSNMAASRWRRS